MERVSLINSNNTLLCSDHDFTTFESWITDWVGGVLFSNLTTKPELKLSLDEADVLITAGKAIIPVVRAIEVPIGNQKIALRYELGQTKTLTGTGTKIFIEIDQTLIDDPTLIEDTYPNTDYAMGKNIGTLKRADDYPTTNPYIKLWEFDWAWNDMRISPKVNWKKVDLTALTGNITTTGNITGQNIISPKGNIQEQIDNIEVQLWITSSLSNEDYLAGEDISKWDSLFVEDMVTFANATNVQNIWDVAWNTRVSIKQIGSGVAGNTIKLSLKKFVSPSVNLNIRLETDNAGSPSGELIDANATATVAPASLTSSLADTEIILDWTIEDNEHWVTLDNIETLQTVYKWVKITLTQQISILTVVKDSNCTATTAYLYDLSWNLLTSASFSTDTATLNYWHLVNGTSYYILVGSDWNPYSSVKQTGSAGFPYSATRLDYENWALIVWLWDISDAHWLTFLSSWTDSGWNNFWVKCIARKNIKLKSVTKDGWDTAYTSVNLYNSSWVLLETASYVSNVATFTWNHVFKKGDYFRLANNLTYWTARYAYYSWSITLDNVIMSWNSYLADSTMFAAVVSVLTEEIEVQTNSDINNIINISTKDWVLIPKWTPYHIVAYQGTYGSETVNGTNYYGIGYSTKDTSTRWSALFNATRWAIRPAVNCYVSSTLSETNLLSKTSALYAYKLPDIPRLATQAYSIGELVKYDFAGISKLLSGLTKDGIYYVSNTPWALSTSAWIVTFWIWVANDTNQLLLSPVFWTTTRNYLNISIWGWSYVTSYWAVYIPKKDIIIDAWSSNGWAYASWRIETSIDWTNWYQIWWSVAGGSDWWTSWWLRAYIPWWTRVRFWVNSWNRWGASISLSWIKRNFNS